MNDFKYIEDLCAWLEPMDYEGFWFAIEPFHLPLQDRSDCDRQIAEGGVSRKMVLHVMKGFAEIELTRKLNLQFKLATPWLKLVKSH